jgi:hypothetical protein
LGIDILDNTAQIWWAGKLMIAGNKLSDHVVGQCRLTISNPVLKAPMVSALENKP